GVDHTGRVSDNPLVEAQTGRIKADVTGCCEDVAVDGKLGTSFGLPDGLSFLRLGVPRGQIDGVHRHAGRKFGAVCYRVGYLLPQVRVPACLVIRKVTTPAPAALTPDAFLGFQLGLHTDVNELVRTQATVGEPFVRLDRAAEAVPRQQRPDAP